MLLKFSNQLINEEMGDHFETLKFSNWLISVIKNDIDIWFVLNCSSSDSTQIILLQFSNEFVNKDMVAILNF